MVHSELSQVWKVGGWGILVQPSNVVGFSSVHQRTKVRLVKDAGRKVEVSFGEASFKNKIQYLDGGSGESGGRHVNHHDSPLADKDYLRLVLWGLQINHLFLKFSLFVFELEGGMVGIGPQGPLSLAAFPGGS